MKICVFGAGAIGGSLAVRLNEAGAEVSVVARGAHGRAIRRDGLTLVRGAERICVRIPCAEDPAELPPSDLMIVTVKGPGLRAVAEALQRSQVSAARTMFVMNGIPWWFGNGLATPLPDGVVEMLDPGGLLQRVFPPAQILWGVVHSSNEVIAPGVVHNTASKNRLIIGRPDGGVDALLVEIAVLLERAGYLASTTTNIREEIWKKMQVVTGLSPVSALTGATFRDLATEADTRQLMATLMHEAGAIGRKLGFTIPDDVEERLDFYRDAPAPVRPSLLQDFESGREPEIENGILAYCAIAAALGQAVPALNLVAILLRAKKKFRAIPAADASDAAGG